MMWTNIPSGKVLAITAAFLALGGLAVAGWMREPSGAAPIAVAPPTAIAPGYATPAPTTDGSNPGAYNPGTYNPGSYNPPADSSLQSSNVNQPVSPEPPVPNEPCNAVSGGSAGGGYTSSGYQIANGDGYYSSITRPVYVQRTVYPNPPAIEGGVAPRTVYVERRHGRSWKKSVAIVAGTAGVGAAIGAVAGGGKGAALGAMSGGAAGFVYDRLTHNR